MRLASSLVSLCLLLAACSPPPAGHEGAAAGAPPAAPAAAPAPVRVDYALAIHGGAGVIPKTMEEAKKAEYVATLEEALRRGRDLLDGGASSLDTVEAVVRHLEDSPLFNAGKGAVFTHEGKNELDAAIMDGSTLACGSVAGLTTVKNPITLARRVMERSPHVFFLGAGAETFADEMGVERVDPSYYFTEHRWQSLQEALAEEKAAGEADDKHGTVGAVALDREGRLAAATSTGGMTNKRYGRVGDVPVIGAGTYANGFAAISCTGWGEKFIRHTVARDVAAIMEYRDVSVQEAAEAVINGKLEPGDGGLIAVSRSGEIALVFNSPGMFRGAADAKGRFEVAIWED